MVPSGILRENFIHYREYNADLKTVGLKLYKAENDWDRDLQDDFRRLCVGVNLTAEVSLVRSEP